MGLPCSARAPFRLLCLVLTVSGILPPAASAVEAPTEQTIHLARSHYDKGMKLLETGKEAEGEAELQESARVFPDFADAHLQLGHLSMRRKEYRQALERYLRARDALVELQLLSRRQEMERLRRLQEGIDRLQQQITQMQLSRSSADPGRIDAAMVQMERLRQEQTRLAPQEERPLPAEIHFYIGNARMSLEQFDQAIEDYQRALSQRPGFGEVHNNLAVIYLYKKDYSRAWEHLHAAETAGVRIEPGFREDLAAAAPDPAAPPPSP